MTPPNYLALEAIHALAQQWVDHDVWNARTQQQREDGLAILDIFNQYNLPGKRPEPPPTMAETVAAKVAEIDARDPDEETLPSWRPSSWEYGPESWRWWHRLRGHHTVDRHDLVYPPYAWECKECEVMYGSD